MNYSTRRLHPGDIPRLTEMIAAAEVLEPTDEIYDAADIAEELAAAGIDLPSASVVIEQGKTVVAAGYLTISPVTDKWRASVFGVVDPAHRRRGLGHQITAILIEQAIELRDRKDPALPVELKMWVHEARAGDAAVAIDAAFTPVRWFFRMTRDLSVPIDPVAPIPGIRIRPYRPTDSESVRLASNESFADHWGSVAMDAQRWQSLIIDSRSFRPDLSFVAESTSPDPRVLGFCLSEEYETETLARGFAIGWVNRLGVTRSGRGQGIATGLLLTCLQAFQQAGYRESALTVDADSPTGAGRIYQRAGYCTVDRTTAYVREFGPDG